MDDTDTTIKIASIVALSILTAFFSAAEALLSRLAREDIKNIAEAGGKQYDLLTSLLRQPQRYSATIITAKSGLIVTIVVLSMSLIDFDSVRSRIFAGFMITFFIVIITEFIPKNYVRGSSENAPVQVLRFLWFVYWGLYIFIKPLSLLGSIGVRILGGKVEPNQDSIVSPEALEALVRFGDNQEILEVEERKMISRILDLPDKVAREIMIPRTDMTCLDVSTPEAEVIDSAIEFRHSRVPIYEDRIDRIIGILHVKDLLDYWRAGKPINLKNLIADRTPFFTPESKKISDLFQDLRANKQHMAIVVDEYGGTAGIVTLEDIVEEIVGEIHDEYDADEAEEFVQDAEHQNAYFVDARMNIDDFNERLETTIEAENVDTIGGFVVDFLGQVPAPEHQFTYQGLLFTILEADERRVHRLRVQVPDESEGTALQPQ